MERKGSSYGKGEIKVKGVVNIVRSWKKENRGSHVGGMQFRARYIYIFLSYEIFESVSRLCVN